MLTIGPTLRRASFERVQGCPKRVVHQLMQPAQPGSSGASTASERPLAVVTPLFAENEISTTGWKRPSNTRRWGRRWWILGGALLALTVTAIVFHGARTNQRSRDAVATGCLDVDDCRALVRTIESTLHTCFWGCDELTALVPKARAHFRSALETAAYEERRRQDHDYAQSLNERERLEAERTMLAERERMANLEREHQWALARIAAEAEQRRLDKEVGVRKQVDYLRQLTRDQRSHRLHACHERGTNCDELVQALVAAAASPAERAALIEAHEEYVTATASLGAARPRLPSAGVR